MKAAIIGNGFISNSHRIGFETLKKEESDIELVAICDIRPEMLEKNSGQRLYTDLDEMLAKEKDLDFVCLCLPTFMHAEYSIKCMKAGLHVLCEKPMALSREDCEKMISCSKETGKRLMIAQVCRFNVARRIIKHFVEEGSFGKPVSAFFTSPDGKPTWGWDNWFADDKRSGGAMLDLQAHTLDLINWYFGTPKYTSVIAKPCAEDFSGYGSISANMVYDNGLFVHTWCDWGISKNQHLGRMIRINFEDGYLYYNESPKYELVAVKNDGTVTNLAGSMKFPMGGFRFEIEYFVRCIEQGIPFDDCPPEESAKVISIMRAQERSANAGGAPVQIEV